VSGPAVEEQPVPVEQEHRGHPAGAGDDGARSTRSVLEGQAEDYATLSRRYADRGDARLAALALWAADLRAVQSLLWGSGIGELEDPTEPLLAVGGAIETALAARETATGQHSPRAVLESAREALLSAFDASVHEQLRSRFCDADHLDDAPPPPPGAANQAVADRLDGRGGEELVADLLATADDCAAVARALAEVGDDQEARRQRVLADLAGFEAYLVLTSAAGGDATLATTELRWGLTARRLTGELDPASVREELCSTVLPAEEPALRSLLDGPGRAGL
jgi:hypothetical protein